MVIVMLCCRVGLQLILNVNQDEYMSEGDDAAGMRLVIHQAQRMPFPEDEGLAGMRLMIHQAQRMPFPEDEGLAINPGQTTSIGLRRVIHVPPCTALVLSFSQFCCQLTNSFSSDNTVRYKKSTRKDRIEIRRTNSKH